MATSERMGDGGHTAKTLARYAPIPGPGCWLWEGPASPRGYGTVGLGVRGRKMFAHRFFYAAHKGPIPEGMFVCHKCDTPLCVNPDHLFLGTHADNMTDRSQKGRYLGKWNGRALLTEEQVRAIRAIGGTQSQRVIASRFGVSRETISDVLTRSTWRHLA